MWFNITLFIIQLSGLIAGFYYWNDYKQTKQKHFLTLIVFSVFIEILTGLIASYLGERFAFLHNMLIIISFSFFLYWFYYLLEKSKVVYVFTAFFLITIIYSVSTNDLVSKLSNTLLLVGTILIIICSIYYFMILIKTNVVIEYKKSQRFWIVTGLLIFHIGFLPVHLFLPIIKGNSLAFRIPMILLNILLYGSYIISFKVAKYKIDE